MIDLVIVSDIRLYREGLSKILGDIPELSIVADGSNIQQALEQIRLHNPDVALLDMRMQDNYKLLMAIENETCSTRFIVLSVPEDETDVLSCAEAGIAGYLSRDSSIDELVDAVFKVYNGEIYCPIEITRHLLNCVRKHKEKAVRPVVIAAVTEKMDVLTRREREVIHMMADGFSNKQIARNLTIEVSTVKNHVHNLLVKLDAKSRTQAVSMMQHVQFVSG